MEPKCEDIHYIIVKLQVMYAMAGPTWTVLPLIDVKTSPGLVAFPLGIFSHNGTRPAIRTLSIILVSNWFSRLMQKVATQAHKGMSHIAKTHD